MTKLMLKLMIAIILSLGNTVYAQPFPYAQVITDPADKDDEFCGIRRDGLVAAVESVIRGNRVKIVNQPSLPKVLIRVAIVSLPTSTTSCAVALKLSFLTFDHVIVPGTIKKQVGDISLCERVSLLTGVSATLHSRIASNLREIAEVCLSKIEREAQ